MPFPINEKYIIATEEKLRVKFPESFRAKMMEKNGGEVETPPDAWRLYPFLDTSDKKRLKRTCNDIVRETTNAKGWIGFPEKNRGQALYAGPLTVICEIVQLLLSLYNYIEIQSLQPT